MFPIDSLSLFKDLNELKRIKSNSSNGLSFAERAFGIGVQCCDCSDSFLSIHDLVKNFIAGSRLGFLGHEILSSNGLNCLLYTSPSPRDRQKSRMPSSA